MAVNVVNNGCLRGSRNAFSDYVSDIASEVAESKTPTSYRPFEGLDFILSHFDQGFPRTISTKVTEGRQILVSNKEEALAWFKAANWLDCKINAYPKFIDWKGINRQAPNFIFIDLDQARFKSRLALDRILDKILKNISEKFGTIVHPSVIGSGHGYHIYLPVEAFVLEGESEFDRFGNPPSRLS